MCVSQPHTDEGQSELIKVWEYTSNLLSLYVLHELDTIAELHDISELMTMIVVMFQDRSLYCPLSKASEVKNPLFVLSFVMASPAQGTCLCAYVVAYRLSSECQGCIACCLEDVSSVDMR